MGLSDGPTTAPNQGAAEDGILSPAEQAELHAAQSACVASIRRIKDPMARFRACLAAVRPFAEILLEAAGAYPGAAPFVAGFRQALEKMGNVVSNAGRAAASDAARGL